MPHPLLDLPELISLEAGRGLVRIPTEQDVPFTRRVQALVDTAEFRRLAQISQLGLVSRVYPGAMHTRFEHALGVFHNALRYLWQLGQDARFRKIVGRHEAELLMVSALLHDLGHWPFCHPIEDMHLDGMSPHEEFAAEFLAPERELAQVLREEWRIEPAEVLDVLVAQSDTQSLRLLRSILSGPIDIDKMDYLERDSLHAGVPYGRNFDKHRLIQSLLLNEAGDGLAISAKGRTAAELMVFARYVMFGEVYWHHAVRSATCMFARAFYELYRGLELKTLFALSESGMIEALRQAARGTSAEGLLEGVFGPRRQLYKRVAEYSLYQNDEIYQLLARQPYPFLVRCAGELARRLGAEIGETLAPTDILIDAPPTQREIEFDVTIYYPKERKYRPLHEVSPVVTALARSQFDDYVKRVRVFARGEFAARIANSEQFAVHLQAAARDARDQAGLDP
jgi:HD superfamily phosphohydrolase